MKSFGYGEVGGVNIRVNNGNPAWDNIKYKTFRDIEFESRWRCDNAENGDVVSDLNLI